MTAPAERPTFRVGKVRAMDLRAGDVISQWRNGHWHWDFIYDVYSPNQDEERMEAEGYGIPSDLDSRDTVVRFARDEDRAQGPETFLDAFVRFSNPYALVDVQLVERY